MGWAVYLSQDLYIHFCFHVPNVFVCVLALCIAFDMCVSMMIYQWGCAFCCLFDRCGTKEIMLGTGESVF